MTDTITAVALVDDPTKSFRVVHGADGVVVVVPIAGVNPKVAAAWTCRTGISLQHFAPIAARPPSSLMQLATLVLAADRRVSAFADTYAHSVGAMAIPVADSLAVETAISKAHHVTSVTFVMLNNAFDETVVDAVRRGNADRVRRGASPLTWGVLMAFDGPRLAWLMAKTLLWLTPRKVQNAGVGRFEGVSGAATLRMLNGPGPFNEVAEPWTDARTLVQSVVAHGVSFDLALGDVVLCGHLDPPLPAARTQHAPTCFHDHVCFRLARDGPPHVRRQAWEATPLFWGIDSCGVIPFRQNAFGAGTSYSLGLLAGAAVAVVGSYLTLMASGLAARAFEALIKSGWTTGEIASALGDVDESTDGFNPYMVLGSPDVRLAERQIDPVTPDTTTFPVTLDGDDTIAIEIPASRPDLRDVLADDGSEIWRAALCCRVDAPARSALVVIFDRPCWHVGHLTLGDVGTKRASMAAHCHEIVRRIGVLVLYGFAADYTERIATLKAALGKLSEISRSRYALRAPIAGASLWTHALEDLLALEEMIGRSFINTVIAQDFSFDRESENGFVPGQLQRSTEKCHICGGALYIGFDRWCSDESYIRKKATCANCFGVGMRLSASSLAAVGIVGDVDDEWFVVAMTLCSAVGRPLRVHVAAAPRRGPAEYARGPHLIEVPARGEACFDLRFPRSTSGVLTYRILVICEGAAEFYTVFDHGVAINASTSTNVETVVGRSPRPGQARPDGLNQIG